MRSTSPESRHGARERHALRHGEAAEEHRHGEGGRLALRDMACGQALDEVLDMLGVERAAVALVADDFLRKTRHVSRPR